MNITPQPKLEVVEPEPIEIVAKAAIQRETSPEPTMVEQSILPTVAHKNTAFIPVFKAWGILYKPDTDGDACAFAQTNGLLCLRQKGNIAAMRSLNRPAVLTVADAQGSQAFTAVLSFTGTTANIATQDASAEITLQQLALQSFNDFTLLWKTPAGYTSPVRPGHSGKLVAHLAEQVTQALNQSWIGAPRTKYDDTLKAQVKAVQRMEGLSPDGVAGPITWIHLNKLNKLDAPSLSTINP